MGDAVVGGIGLGIAGDVAVDIGVNDGVASVGVTFSCAGWAG